MRKRFLCLGIAGLCLGLVAGPAAGEVESEDAPAERRFTLRTGLKSSLLISRGPEDPLLPSERDQATALWRFRFDLTARLSEETTAAVAYEHRARVVSEGRQTALSLGILPPAAPAPYRIWQLDAALASAGDSFQYRHELDRAYVAKQIPRGELTVGRQAVGWGRGVLFSAVDLFAPFSPLEVDREWRRGVDAVRAEVRLSDTTSLDAVAAFGESLAQSAFVGRLRGYRGRVDAEVIFGKRARDVMAAGTVSAAVGDAEAHAELAIFNTPEAFPGSGLFGADHLVPKVVVGGSYTFNVGQGLTLLGEYHYSGFGAGSIAEAIQRLLDPQFRERFLRGDTQIVERQAAALQASYPVNEALSSSLLWLHSPQDGSGVVAPALSWNISDQLGLTGQFFFPYGRGPVNGVPRTEYGNSELTGFIQLRLDY